MRCQQWHGGRLALRGTDPGLASWLTEPGSLTARCQAACREFRVRLLHYGYSRPFVDETGGRINQRVREVLLECDGIPVIFAHTTLPDTPTAIPSGRSRGFAEGAASGVRTGGQLSRWLARLGSRSLGSLLFAHPGFVRGQIEYCRLDARHPLFHRVVGLSQPVSYLWARRSLHCLGKQAVLVTEVFLPAIARVTGKAESSTDRIG